MENNDFKELTNSAWKERVYIETAEHVITGYVYMPKIGKKQRLLSEILNASRHFIAVKECTLEYKNNPSKPIESHDFMEVNRSSILIMRPLNE